MTDFWCSSMLWRIDKIYVELVHRFYIFPALQILSKEKRESELSENWFTIYDLCFLGYIDFRAWANIIWQTLIIQPHPASLALPSFYDR